MSPRSCQQLPFSTFSLTFLFWQGLLSLQQQLRGRWAQAVAGALARWALGESRRPPLQATSCLLRQKTLWVKPKFLGRLHYSCKHRGGAAHQPRSGSVSPRLCVRKRPQKSGCAGAEGCYHRNRTSPLKSWFLIPLLEEKGSTAVLFFTGLSGRVWFCCRHFFQCHCVFSSLWVPVSRR